MFLLNGKSVELQWPENGTKMDMVLDCPKRGDERVKGVLFVADTGEAYLCHGEKDYDQVPASPNLMGFKYSRMFLPRILDGRVFDTDDDLWRFLLESFRADEVCDANFEIDGDDCVIVEEYLAEHVREV